MQLSTVVYDAYPEYNGMTYKTNYILRESDRSISPGLVDRLVRYAEKRMNEAGFPCFENVSVSFVTESQYYHVEFRNNRNGIISLNGILIGPGGHPCLDHGFNIQHVWTNN